jgi:hypothetical protein
MILNPKQIEEILRLIEFNHTLFIGQNLGVDILSPDDKKLLNRYGIKIDDLRKDFSPYDKQYYFGRLSAALGDKNAKKLSYNDFFKYIRKGQYIPLNQREKDTLKLAKQRSYAHLKNLESRTVLTTSGIISQNSLKFREQFEKVAKKSIERAVLERDTISSVVSEIGNATGDWTRDLGRIAATEMQTVYEEGRAMEIERRGGADALVYKEVYPQACRFCISFYTTSGIGSPPKLFTLSELRANGSNIGRKQKDWLPVLGTVHPFCRCQLHTKPDGYVWDQSKQMFVPPAIDKNKPKKGIKITVGDKVYQI